MGDGRNGPSRTEQEKAEAALRERFELREQLANLAALTPGLLSSFRLRPDGTACLPYNSPRFREIYGLDPEAVANDAAPLLALIHPDDVAAVTASIAESARAMEPWHAEYRVRNPERGVVWVETWSNPVREPDGSILWSGYVVDVSGRKRLEDALRGRESMLRATLESTADGVIVVDVAGRIAAYNQRFAQLWRLPLDLLARGDDAEALAAVLAQLSHPQEFLDKVRELYAQPEASSFDVLHFVDGRVFERHSQPQRVGDEIVGRVWSFHDVTTSRRAEEALRRSEGLLRLITDALPVLVVYIDADYRCRSVNRTCEQWFGLGAAEIIGHDIRSLLGTSLWDAIAPYGDRALAGEVVTYEREVRFCGQAERWLHVTYTPDRDQDGAVRGFVGLIHDITEQKRSVESQLRSKKLEALGTLSGGIAHDFNNILLAINGNAALAAADLAPDHPAQQSLMQISKAGARAANLVRQILAFSRSEGQRREVLDLAPVVQEALQLVRSILPPLVQVRSTFAADLPAITADSTQVHEIVVNLATNAADAIGGDGGVIDFWLDAVTVDANSDDRATGLAPGRYARLTVTDTGHGMERAIAERIFDPFFTTKPAGQGTGLGLSVVHGITTSCGGAIAVDSEPGKGTTFRLYLPAAARGTPTVAEPRRAPTRGRGERVLYVDDDEMLVALVTRVLTNLGYRVTGSGDPFQVLRDFQARPDDFDVVVTDLSMPGMSGIKLARELLAVRPDLPILMTTGYVRPGDETAVREAGIRALILKPNTIEELGDELDRLFRAQWAPSRHDDRVESES
jgi:PAS domain S-box-containing protein